MLRFEELRKRFVVRRGLRETIRSPFSASETVLGLDGATGEVHAGELFGLLGPNGAGKSTLFRILATYLLPDSGTASVGGHDVVAQPEAARRQVACVMANERALHWRLSAIENLRLYAALHRIPSGLVDRRVRDALAVVELADMAERVVGTLSSGQRQRVLLARALMVEPRLLLLDEPTRSLDPVSARSFRRFVRDRIMRELGCTVVVATHDSDEAFDWCDRVMVMHRGRTVAVDRADVLAQTIGDAAVGVWTTAPSSAAFASLLDEKLVYEVQLEPTAASGNWSCVRLRLPNGPNAAADVLTQLVAQGVPISRFERLDRSLADLLDRVVGAPVDSGAIR